MSELSDTSSRFTSRKKRIWKKALFPGGRARARPVRRLKAQSLDFRPSWVPIQCVTMGLIVILIGAEAGPVRKPASLNSKLEPRSQRYILQVLIKTYTMNRSCDLSEGCKTSKRNHPLCLSYQDVFVAWILKITVKKGGLANGERWYDIVTLKAPDEPIKTPHLTASYFGHSFAKCTFQLTIFEGHLHLI